MAGPAAKFEVGDYVTTQWFGPDVLYGTVHTVGEHYLSVKWFAGPLKSQEPVFHPWYALKQISEADAMMGALQECK